MHTYEQLEKERLARGERGDCCVKALAVARQISYEAALTITSQYGRPYRRGMYTAQVLRMLRGECGAERLDSHEMDRLRQSIGVQNLTPNNVVKALRKCGYDSWRFVALVKGHALGIDRCKVIDWAEGRKHYITHLIPVRPEPKAETPTLQRKMRHKKARRLGVDPKTGLPMVWAA